MDLLLSRYASPFSFIDGIIRSNRFSEWVLEFMKIVYDEKEEKSLWEYFLHKVFDEDMSFEDFKEKIKIDQKNKTMTKDMIETTVKMSLDVLKNFKPE